MQLRRLWNLKQSRHKSLQERVEFEVFGELKQTTERRHEDGIRPANGINQRCPHDCVWRHDAHGGVLVETPRVNLSESTALLRGVVILEHFGRANNGRRQSHHRAQLHLAVHDEPRTFDAHARRLHLLSHSDQAHVPDLRRVGFDVLGRRIGMRKDSHRNHGQDLAGKDAALRPNSIQTTIELCLSLQLLAPPSVQLATSLALGHAPADPASILPRGMLRLECRNVSLMLLLEYVVGLGIRRDVEHVALLDLLHLAIVSPSATIFARIIWDRSIRAGVAPALVATIPIFVVVVVIFAIIAVVLVTTTPTTHPTATVSIVAAAVISAIAVDIFVAVVAVVAVVAIAARATAVVVPSPLPTVATVTATSSSTGFVRR